MYLWMIVQQLVLGFKSNDWGETILKRVAKQIGLWVAPGFESALAARAILGELLMKYPDSDLLVLGSQENLFLFEMDRRISFHIPLIALAPKRPSEFRLLRWFEERNQLKKLRRLNLSQCVGVSVYCVENALNQKVVGQFGAFQNFLGIKGSLICKPLDVFLQYSRPVLQASPESLAFATQHYRAASPNLSRIVLLFDSAGIALDSLDLHYQNALATICSEKMTHVMIAVVGNIDRLVARYVAKKYPSWMQLNLPQAMGLIAYADRVISFSKRVTQICIEMDRSNQLCHFQSSD
jgi:hypothetical protein